MFILVSCNPESKKERTADLQHKETEVEKETKINLDKIKSKAERPSGSADRIHSIQISAFLLI
jgi:hypothetical protein